MLGLITGSGYYNLESLHDPEVVVIDTPYGAAPLTRARWNGGPQVLFLRRHGSDHSVPPHVINYRANVWALREAGATAIVATAVSGGMVPGMQPGDMVVIDDFIDFTTGRPSTYFDAAGNLTHTEMGDPYDAKLRAAIVAAAEAIELAIVDGGTYCATNGPRFETKAEIAMMRQLGGDLVGMTGCPEVVLANELGVPYASIGVISNMAAGLGDQEFTVAEIMDILGETVAPLERLLRSVIERFTP
jgi:5'-methylthioadenosine phosphorylase